MATQDKSHIAIRTRAPILRTDQGQSSALLTSTSGYEYAETRLRKKEENMKHLVSYWIVSCCEPSLGGGEYVWL